MVGYELSDVDGVGWCFFVNVVMVSFVILIGDISGMMVIVEDIMQCVQFEE